MPTKSDVIASRIAKYTAQIESATTEFVIDDAIEKLLKYVQLAETVTGGGTGIGGGSGGGATTPQIISTGIDASADINFLLLATENILAAVQSLRSAELGDIRQLLQDTKDNELGAILGEIINSKLLALKQIDVQNAIDSSVDINSILATLISIQGNISEPLPISTVTNGSSSGGSEILLLANPNRKYFELHNYSFSPIYINFQSTASEESGLMIAGKSVWYSQPNCKVTSSISIYTDGSGEPYAYITA